MSRSVLVATSCSFALLASLAGAQTKTAELVGSQSMESFGYAVAVLGDVDGDGLPDWAGGAPFHNIVTTIPGRVYVCKGSTAAPIHVLNGALPGDDFGYALADAGDVDGDGVHDLLVGAPDFPQTSGHDFGTPGYVELFSGASGALLLHVAGDNANDMFGTSVAGLGDVDGDSIGDFAVGAVGYDGAAASGGLVRLISGASGATIWSAAEAQAGAGLGSRLARIGDLDGDGIADLVVGAPNFDGPPVDAGAAFVLSGASGAKIRTWLGEGSKTRFGGAVAAVGDLDLDGFEDVAVGAVEAPYGTSRGKLYVFSGATGALLFDKRGPKDKSYLGFSVAGAGDLDGDGRNDLAVGGVVYSTNGQSYDGLISVLSGASGNEIGRVLGGSAEYLGWSVAGAGDVDGDGRLDLLGSGIGGNQGQRGFVRVYATDHPMPPSTYCVAKTNSLGCSPSISSSGSPSVSGPDDFTVHVDQAINQKSGLFVWSTTPWSSWFQNGTLCVGPPQKRTVPMTTGGSGGGPDCSGTLSYLFTNAYLQSQGISAGSMFFVQGWYRDPALPFNSIGLSDALLVVLAP